MRKLNPEQKQELRANLLDLVTNRLPPLMRLPIPESIRTQKWFRESGLEAMLDPYVLHCGKMDVGNGKTPPALKAWLMDEEAGLFKDKPMVIGATSANWGMSSGLVAPIFDVKGFTAVLERSVPLGKIHQLEACGAEWIYTKDGIPATQYVYELAKQPGYHLIDQYVHPGSVLGHEWTMRHLTQELSRIGLHAPLFGAVTGTTSTLMAAKKYLPHDVRVFGVASMNKAERVPGSRAPENLDELRKLAGYFHYETAIDFPLVTTVTKDEAFTLNAELVLQYLKPMGPTGALLIAGFYHLLREHLEHGTLGYLKNPAGRIAFVGLIMDMHLPYLDDAGYRKFFRS